MSNNRLLSFLLFCGRPLSPLYSLAMRIRALLYQKGLLASTRLPVPVVSVGNLSMGGTGKTPMVIYLARLLSKRRRPGVVSRGYGGRSRQPVNLVADGLQVLLTAAEAGDEPVLLANSLPGVAVVTSHRRALGAEALLHQGLADLLILDDGFQHLALHRDLDLVLFSDRTSLDSARVFPGGMLREPRSALKRADCFVITGTGPGISDRAATLREWLRHAFPETPLYTGRYQPVALYRPGQGRVDMAELAGVPFFAFCGLANPDSFRETLERTLEIKGWQAFADHHPYSRADLDGLTGKAMALGCAGLITTEKDSVKIKDLTIDLPVWVLMVELRMEDGFDRFVQSRVEMSAKVGCSRAAER